jgi:plastocyanin
MPFIPMAALFALPALLAASPVQAAGNTIRGRMSIKTPGDDPGPAIVYVTGFTAVKTSKDPEVLQKDEAFSTGFLPIVQGQSIRFINRDSKSHNVFSNSEVRKFDLGTTEPGSESKVAFPKPGLVDIFCNIHPSMEMRVLVLPNPAFAVAGTGQEYKITGIPDGKFKVFAWHPRGRPVSKEVELNGGQVKTLDWSLDAGVASAPHLNKYGKPYREKKRY